MEYLKAKDFSKIWDISERRIIKLCQENRINGAIKNGKIWEIPANTNKPSDKRSNIYKYINIEKKIMVINVIPELKNILQDLITKEGYTPEFADLKNIDLNNISSYYENLIYFKEKNKLDKNFIINFSDKLNYESSIVLVENIKNSQHIQDLAKILYEKMGININSLLLDLNNENSLIDYNEIARNIIELLIHFKSTTGNFLTTTAHKLTFSNKGKTNDLLKGPFYQAINTCFKNLNCNNHIWCASTMLEDEWTTSPEEMKFRILNLELANRGVNIERIFIIKKSKIDEYKNNKTLKIYMQSNIKTTYVDYDEIIEKEPNLLKIVGNGWDGIDNTMLIVDLAPNTVYRGYISKNKDEIHKSYKCFKKLKNYEHDLKEILK